ncbi:MAG: response regulator [Anaerolineales bacterium]
MMQTSGQTPRGTNVLVLNSLSVEAGLIRTWLEAEGYRVEVVPDKGGFEARVEKAPPDLIVMAQIESGWAATTLFQQLKGNESTKNIPIVFLATTGVPQVEQGGGVLLRRPFGAAALLGAVQKAMNSKG